MDDFSARKFHFALKSIAQFRKRDSFAHTLFLDSNCQSSVAGVAEKEVNEEKFFLHIKHKKVSQRDLPTKMGNKNPGFFSRFTVKPMVT